MKVAVVSEVELGSPRAHFINVVKTGGGFARLGHDVTVLCRPSPDGCTAQDVARTMGEPSLDWLLAPSALDTNAFASWACASARNLGADLAYCRTFVGAIACADTGLPTALETHAYIGTTNPDLCDALRATARQNRPIASLITISHRLADHFASRGADRSRIHVVPDGVDVGLFQRPAAEDQIKSPMKRFPGAKVLYSGHLYDYKGIPTLFEAAGMLNNATFHLLGGLDEDISRWRTRAVAKLPTQLIVHGRVDHASVPPWLWDADLLLLPPSAREPSKDWTSPVKLGEYLASGTPIVASRIPALEDWLGEDDVFWFEADDAVDLARSVRTALSESPAAAAVRRSRAALLADTFSYTRRAARIIDVTMHKEHVDA